MKYYLIVAKGKHQGMPIPIEIDLFTIGSGPMCQMRTKVEGIGPQQCALVTRERKLFIRDLGSEDSTIVNGAVVPPSEEWPLHAGDHIEVGPLEFLVQFRETALSQRDLEEWALKCLDVDSQDTSRSTIEELDAAMNISQKYANAAAAAASMIDRLSAQRGLVKGRLRIAREGTVTTVRLNDQYLVDEAELALIKKELTDNLGAPNLKVLLDFKNVRRMSSMGSEMIGDLARWQRTWGSTMAVCRLKPEIEEALRLMPALKDIRFFKDKQPALDGRW